MAKLIQINQKTASKLNTIINNQERFEAMLNEQKDQISNIMSVLDSRRNVETEVEVKKKGKTKKKDKNSDEFYHVNIRFKVMYFFILFTKYNICMY